MSSLFDVPAQLALLLSLAASGGAEAPAPEFTRPAIVMAAGAEGPFDFSEQVWLEAVEGGSGGPSLASEQRRIFRTSNGKYYIPRESERWHVLGLRREPDTAGRVAYGFAKRNGARMRARLGREASASELYMAHALGSDMALSLIEVAAAAPHALLSVRLPELARRHPELALVRGRPSSVGDALRRLRQAAERRPSGAEVAAWFARNEQTALAGGLKGSLSETAAGGREALDWSTVVTATP